jgi:hypothetical protein
VLNLEAVLPVFPALVALKLSICNEPPPALVSPREESLSALSGALTQAKAATAINKPNINNRFPIINGTAAVKDGFNKIVWVLFSFFYTHAHIVHFVQWIIAHILFDAERIGAFFGEFKVGHDRQLVAV